MALPKNILIVGGGVFGLSTALSLSSRHPASKVTLLESSPIIPNPEGSSVDTSRIVRADYSNPVYSKLGAAAIDRWRNTEWGANGRYTQNGLILVYPNGQGNGRDYAMKSYKNVKELEGDKVEFLPSKKDVLRAAPAYSEELDVEGGYVNWGSGWSDAGATVAYAKQLLDKEGKVVFKTGEVERLLYDEKEKDKVTGVVLSDDTTLTADLVVLATGAWTAKLIDLRGRTLSTGQALAYMQITDEEQERLYNMPTVLNFATGMFIIPPRDNLLKIARHGYGYHNPVTVSVPGPDGKGTMQVSIPEKGIPIPLEGEQAFRDAMKQFLPDLADRPFVKTRVCWYTDTPEGDFIVTHHPTSKNLFIATGGSGHAYKFFPVLGDKVVDAMEGTLEPELRDLWKWPEAKGADVFEGTEDGSRSGQKGLLLMEELAKSKRESKL
ncbi:hypothetical protein SI65_05762 [Aspergillus cristatus]|uniref:FAD dependent oxidoreductase domain-containing protein n=1 Tax=Aspergillus cristatus TaxID=573508 RepID=A0A1E3BDT8_ASPCR|nr:hypothetical protein SI65_05762 [Aspergillus cristatus]